MRPLTYTCPKGLLPIAGKPILDYVLDSLRGTEIEDVEIVVGYLKGDIKDRYGDGSEFGLDISYFDQPEQNGTAHAISCTYSEEPFVVINGDVYCDTESLQETIKKHRDEGSAVTLGTYRVKSAASYGVIKADHGKMTEIVEKPEKTTDQLINAGVYLFEPQIYDAIERTPNSERGEKEITTSIEILIEEGETVTVNELDSWVHVGRPWDLLSANERALKNHEYKVEGEIEPGAHVTVGVTIEKDTIIRSGAYIKGPAYIGEGSDIGPNCYIRPCTSIGKNVRIGNAVEVKNSIIMDGSHAAHHTYVGDSIVGTNCNFGSGTKVGNLRLDAGNVVVNLRGELVDSGRRKLGAVLGDGVQTGINSMINPGVKMGPNSAIGPGTILYEDLSPHRCVLVEQKEREMGWKE